MGTPSVIGLALAIAVFGVIANHAKDMYKERKYREMFGSLFWAAIPIAIFAIFWVVNENPSDMARNITLGLVGAVLGASGLIWCGYLIHGGSANARPKPGETIVAQNGPTINTWNQSGGTNIINVGPSRLSFETSIAEQLASKLPPGKPITLQSVGSASDQTVADQYQQFLQSRGFHVAERHTIGMMAPPPDRKISILDAGAKVIVTIAPSAN